MAQTACSPVTIAGMDQAARIRELEEALARAESERAAALEELADKEEELKRFIYVVSHDLRSPIVTIQGFAGMVQRDVDTDKLERVPRDLARIKRASIMMSDLLDVLLEISRIGRMIGEIRRGSVRQLVDEALAELGETATESGLVVEIGDDLPEIYGEWPRLIDSFKALLDNAIKFKAKDAPPKVEISVRPAEACPAGEHPHGDVPAIVVRDHGIGIDPAQVEKAFELFHQLDNSYPGDGLGLSIVQRVVASHGGETWIESVDTGGGCAICFTLRHPPTGG